MDRIIICMNANNKQTDYSKVMQIINAVETETKDIQHMQIPNEMSVQYYWLREKHRIYYKEREIVQNVEQSRNGMLSNSDWIAHPLTDFQNVVAKKKLYKISYYVRVKSGSEEDIKNIQYLVLIIQQFPSIRGRIQVFLEPFERYFSAQKAEWAYHKEEYHKYSHYLRFICYKYQRTFYSSFFESASGKVKIEQLSLKKAGIQSTFFPLLEVDSKMHTAFARYCFVDKQGKPEHGEIENKFSELKDLMEIARRLLERRIKEELPKTSERKKYSEDIYRILAEGKITTLEYAIFSMIVPIATNLSDDEVRGYQERARSISNGLFQIIENIVIHSSNHRGVFTFRVIKNGQQHLNSILVENITGQLNILEIDVADLNMDETILDNFQNKLGESGSDLKNINIAISHFFERFGEGENEAKKAWEKFRTLNPVKCLGLSRLGIELRLSKAILEVRSNTSYKENDERLSYKENSYSISEFHYPKEGEYIPGTQFVVILPILRYEKTKQHNANIFLNGIGALREKDSLFANFVSFKPESFVYYGKLWPTGKKQYEETDIIEIDHAFCDFCKKDSTYNAKDLMVNMWINELNEWETHLKDNEEKVYYLNLMEKESQLSPWGAETLCKGIVDSIVLHSSKIKYLAIINSNSGFIKMMIDTMVMSHKYLQDGVQLYLHEHSGLNDIVLAGADFESVILNALQYCYAKGEPPIYLQNYNKKIQSKRVTKSVELFPFDVILCETKGGITLFEKYIENVAQKPLVSTDEAGYLIQNAHMRLGNKVHVKEFYEISILFRKPRIARKLALLIVRQMVAEKIELSDNLLFFGYASYSRPILTSVIEIVKKYQKSDNFVEFAVYQNDIVIQKTLTHISPKVRMYYSKEIPYNMSVNVIQIVPISSTLTTFKKMWDMYLTERNDNGRHDNLIKNYTLFWVRDLQNSKYKTCPTNIEKQYWNKIQKDKVIKTSLITPFPRYFCYKETVWSNPLNCEDCYPSNLLDEIALVETDITSTVPSQQLEVKMAKPSDNNNDRHDVVNEMRLIDLNNCIYYGHICRDANHFQYYIDTTQYFHKEKNYISSWLTGLQRNSENVSEINCLNIIVTPQHPTNVEFGHYVNDYYFEGSADVVTIDSTKEYRTNIIAKYADVRAAIKAAQESGTEVKFIFVDDTIITGATYRRVNNLLHSLVPETIRNPIQFSEVFVLVNRLSYYSRMDYVENVEQDFHAFVNIEISSIRNFGDSCAMCTLYKNSELFFKRASTTEISRYWNKKKYDYRVISFDKYTQDSDYEEKQQKGYYRMLCSHYVKAHMHIGEDIGSNILNVVGLFLKLEDARYIQPGNEFVQTLMDNEKRIDCFVSGNLSPIYYCVFCKNVEFTIKAFLKILCRPFFSYGKNFRQTILDFFLLLTESFLNPEFDKLLKNKYVSLSDKKSYLNNMKLREKFWKLCSFLKKVIPAEKRVLFIQNYLMEGLADLRSNYIYRLATMQRFEKMEIGQCDTAKVYRRYERMIHRLINSNADETKSLWLEYLLINGYENTADMNNLHNISACKVSGNESFKSFWDSLFIENTRIYYDSMLNFVNKASEIPEKEESVERAVEYMWDDYYIRNMRRFISLEVIANHEEGDNIEERIKAQAIKTAQLLYLLKNEKANGIERYNKMKRCMEELLYEGDILHILTRPFEGAKDSTGLYAVTNSDKVKVTSIVVNRVKIAIKSDSLRNKSFYLGDNYIILCIDNNDKYLKENNVFDKSLIKIQPLYFYIECDTEDHFRVILRVRKILMYRYQILRWIETDFNNNTMSILTEQININQQLMRERAGDHNSSTDILTTGKLLQRETKNDSDELKIYHWLLLKVYVNMRIARLFRCEWSDSYETIRDKAYTRKKNEDSFNKAFVTLGESFFGKTEINLSPKQYFTFVADCFQFDMDILGERKHNISLEEMEDMFCKLSGRCEKEFYYKQEYIICIIFDILFNAIKTCRNWEIDIDKFFRETENKDVPNVIKENDIIAQFYILKKEPYKCRIQISIEKIPDKEIAYMVFRNKVATLTQEQIVFQNEKLSLAIDTKDTIGMSLQVMKWYTETLGGEKNVEADFRYAWNDVDCVVEFVTKLPILFMEGDKR